MVVTDPGQPGVDEAGERRWRGDLWQDQEWQCGSSEAAAFQ